jgi:outer membrane protein TolC
MTNVAQSRLAVEALEDENAVLRAALKAIIDNYDDLEVPTIEVIEDARELLNAQGKPSTHLTS